MIRFNKNQNGSALSEFIIVLPFFIIIISGILKLAQVLIETSMAHQNTYEIARRAASIPVSEAETELDLFARNLSANWGRFIDSQQDQLQVSFDYENVNGDPTNIDGLTPIRANIRYNAPLENIISGYFFGMPTGTSALTSSPFLLRAPELGVGLNTPDNPVAFTCCSAAHNGVTNYCSPSLDLNNPFCN
jgi:hypothetical protein